MIDRSKYDYICHTSDQLQEPFSLKLRPELGTALGKTVSEIFPQFAQAFPFTTKSMEDHWPKPLAAFLHFRNNWQSFLLIEREDLNLFFSLTFVFDYTEGALFDQEHAMLPIRWLEMYRYFESFVITPDSIKPMDWINTPFNYPSRLSIDSYREKIPSTQKADFNKFAKDIGSDRSWLKCWLYTEAGDALFLDEKRNDHKVYHIHQNRFEDFYVLKNPGNALDKYLAHYVSGGSPKDFNFREE